MEEENVGRDLKAIGKKRKKRGKKDRGERRSSKVSGEVLTQYCRGNIGGLMPQVGSERQAVREGGGKKREKEGGTGYGI